MFLLHMNLLTSAYPAAQLSPATQEQNNTQQLQ
jgi:hypothetical protein